MGKRDKVTPATSETKAEYMAEEARYFGGRGDATRPGLSAADAAMADKHLPSKKQEHEMLEYWEKNLTKSSRSGAFSKPGSGPLILPNGRQAMDFIDKHATPGQYKPQEERPVLKEQTRKVDVPPAAVTLDERCVDCLQLIDSNDASNIVPYVTFIITFDTTKLFSIGLEFGDIVLATEHLTCARNAHALSQNDRAAALILVREGAITDKDELEEMVRTGRVARLHTGHEMSAGDYYLHKRKQRIEQTIEDMLICLDKTSKCYRRNRKPGETGEEK